MSIISSQYLNNLTGNNIKKFRKDQGLTKEELAAILCVTSQAVSKWESENGLPDTAQIVPLHKRICRKQKTVHVNSVEGS